MYLRPLVPATAALALCLGGCVTSADRPATTEAARRSDPAPVVTPATAAAQPAVQPAAPVAPPAAEPAAPPAAVPVVELKTPVSVATVQAEEPRYLPPESLKRFRYAKPPPEPRAAPAQKPPGASPSDTAGPAAAELPKPAVVAVTAGGDELRYAPPESLKQWGSGRKVPLYADPEAAPWQASPSEPRLQNAAVSCNYKDEGGVRGRVMLLVNDFKVTRFNARIEMPNGGVCQFDSKNMQQRPFEQGLALAAKDGECIVRMWEQKHRITVAAYSCGKQCSKGSFSYLWPILMDTRIGTCY